MRSGDTLSEPRIGPTLSQDLGAHGRRMWRDGGEIHPFVHGVF
jgi:hypothetical protein